MGFLPWGIRVAFSGENLLRHACWVFQCLHNPPNSDMDFGIFNVRTDVNSYDCTRGCTDTVEESALKVDSGRKIPCGTGESNRRRQRAGPMLYQLSYIVRSWQQQQQQQQQQTAETVQAKVATGAAPMSETALLLWKWLLLRCTKWLKHSASIVWLMTALHPYLAPTDWIGLTQCVLHSLPIQ